MARALHAYAINSSRKNPVCNWQHRPRKRVLRSSPFSVKQINFKQKCYTSASLLPTSNLFLCFPLPQYISTGIQCEDPGKLTMRNGNITSDETNFFYGATLLFECNEGYELKGSKTVSCLENGWIPRRWPYCSMEGGFWPSSLSPISFHHFPYFCFVFCFCFFWMMWNMPFHALFWISNWNPNRESLSWSWNTRRRSPIWIQNSWKYDAVFLSSRI